MAMLDLISIMLRKKDELYPGDKRLIVNYKMGSRAQWNRKGS